MSAIKPPAEMARIRELEAKLQEKLRREFKPEKNEYKPLAYFEIGRYTTGAFRGLFIVTQLLTDDGKGKTLKNPLRKTVADGVDIHIAMSNLETALRRRVFK